MSMSQVPMDEGDAHLATTVLSGLLTDPPSQTLSDSAGLGPYFISRKLQP